MTQPSSIDWYQHVLDTFTAAYQAARLRGENDQLATLAALRAAEQEYQRLAGGIA